MSAEQEEVITSFNLLAVLLTQDAVGPFCCQGTLLDTGSIIP